MLPKLAQSFVYEHSTDVLRRLFADALVFPQQMTAKHELEQLKSA